MAGETVIVFDFDKTIIACDSDNWVVDEFGFNELLTHLLPLLPWNSLMDRMMEEIHSIGKTGHDVAECLERVPVHPSMISAIKAAHALGCELRILSDANPFFIETVLKRHGIIDCFKRIVTNPSFFDAQGRLRILPYHDFNATSHGCDICPPNMCKGLVLKRMRDGISAEGKKRFVFVGDGTPDFCAGLALHGDDYLLPRKGFPIWDLIRERPTLVQAKIHEWSDWDELEILLLKTVTAGSDQPVSVGLTFQDCSFIKLAESISN